jgi:predicted transposase/invertase (TIGR01784 family)
VTKDCDEMKRLISFDWALKRILRSKANFDVLEGFLTELLGVEVTILEVLESESNKERADDKSNRVDLKVKLGGGELVVIEVQAQEYKNFLQRVLFASSKVVVEHMREGQAYEKVVKVISVSVLHFGLADGDDYIYRGRTVFRGLHRDDELRGLGVFPDYYLLRVNRFDDVAKNTLDQWIYFLKNQEIPEGFTARGLAKAKKILDKLLLPDSERVAYERYQDDLHDAASLAISQDRLLADATERGIAKGHAEERLDIARKLLAALDDAAVAAATGLTTAEVARLRAKP